MAGDRLKDGILVLFTGFSIYVCYDLFKKYTGAFLWATMLSVPLHKLKNKLIQLSYNPACICNVSQKLTLSKMLFSALLLIASKRSELNPEKNYFIFSIFCELFKFLAEKMLYHRHCSINRSCGKTRNMIATIFAILISVMVVSCVLSYLVLNIPLELFSYFKHVAPEEYGSLTLIQNRVKELIVNKYPSVSLAMKVVSSIPEDILKSLTQRGDNNEGFVSTLMHLKEKIEKVVSKGKVANIKQHAPKILKAVMFLVSAVAKKVSQLNSLIACMFLLFYFVKSKRDVIEYAARILFNKSSERAEFRSMVESSIYTHIDIGAFTLLYELITFNVIQTRFTCTYVLLFSVTNFIPLFNLYVVTLLPVIELVVQKQVFRALFLLLVQYVPYYYKKRKYAEMTGSVTMNVAVIGAAYKKFGIKGVFVGPLSTILPRMCVQRWCTSSTTENSELVDFVLGID